MTKTIANPRPVRNTSSENSMGIIVGCQRLRRATWEDAIGIARRGSGFVRSGQDIVWVWSEAFETEAVQ